MFTVDKSEDEVQNVSIIKDCDAITILLRLPKYIKKAKEQLKHLPDIPTRLTLNLAADFVGVRKF